MGFLNTDGLSHLVQGIKALLEKKVDKVEGKSLSTNDYTNEDKLKLAGLNNYTHPSTPGNKHIPSGGKENQILKWSSDGTASWADEKDTTYEAASTVKDGLMSSQDKTKLDSIANGANNYTHPAHSAHQSGVYKITVDELGHVTGAQPMTKQDVVSLGIPGQDTTYTDATDHSSGLMSSADKAKLDKIADEANKYQHPAHTQHESGVYKVTVDSLGHVTDATPITKEDITKLGIPDKDTKYANASRFQSGLMTSTDKEKLDSIPSPNTIATQTYVSEQIAKAGHISKSIVKTLPSTTEAKENIIYMVPKGKPGENNYYDEYMLIEQKLELIGNTQTVVDAIQNGEIDRILRS